MGPAESQFLSKHVTVPSLLDPADNESKIKFPGDPVVETSMSNAGDIHSIPSQGGRMSEASSPKSQNVNIATNSITTLKMDHIKKNL